MPQSRLSFRTMKRAASSSAGDKRPNKRTRSMPAPSPIQSFSEDSDDELQNVDDIEFDDEEEEEEEEKPRVAKPKVVETRASIVAGKKKAGEMLDPADKKWNKAHAVAVKAMDRKKPIHPEGKTRIDTILHVFDLSYQYGPCTGYSRLERWNRAEALGLKPPVEIKEILTSDQGHEYAACVLDRLA
ncbi:DNA polymerase delta, subunit 4-domain-containing protein [Mycena floridula]|nr:DNA polymerase delta, subunit 4-domain-containing protein [Mycena floridula]